ncbi:MAG: PstS family phosphate ABC transporter substrate-binding protein [Gloeocapsa sp. DLM2.Bin57]|nr:MAG: PstS family phosphate ABC transporter substrate-binding protein [Gloeocapsa sp. DLM2.Bin57]
MKISKLSIFLCLLVAVFTLAAGRGYSQIPERVADNVIDIDGSSTVYPITAAIQQAFEQEAGDLQVSVSFSGTGGGFRKFCAGETDINGASRPISNQEMETCRANGIGYIEIPVAFDALTIVVNPNNDWVDNITTEELKTIWETSAQGRITNWQQVNPAWKDEGLLLFAPGVDSGTYDYFNEAILNANTSRSDIVASEDDDILVQGVNQSLGGLGYFGLSYYFLNQDKLKALSVNGVAPTRENVENNTYQPLSRPLFIYVNIQSAQKNPQFRRFIDFYLKNATRIIEQVGYIPLPEEAYHIGFVRFTQGKVGTVFNGVPEPNLTILEVLQREQQF